MLIFLVIMNGYLLFIIIIIIKSKYVDICFVFFMSSSPFLIKKNRKYHS